MCAGVGGSHSGSRHFLPSLRPTSSLCSSPGSLPPTLFLGLCPARPFWAYVPLWGSTKSLLLSRQTSHPGGLRPPPTRGPPPALCTSPLESLSHLGPCHSPGLHAPPLGPSYRKTLQLCLSVPLSALVSVTDCFPPLSPSPSFTGPPLTSCPVFPAEQTDFARGGQLWPGSYQVRPRVRSLSAVES